MQKISYIWSLVLITGSLVCAMLILEGQARGAANDAAPSHEAQQASPKSATAREDEPYNEAYRPQFHFTYKKGWMSDINGLFYYDGEYHFS